MKSSNRDLSIDFVRGVAIIIVVIGHAAQRVGGAYLLESIIQSFQMPLFMLISGYCLGFRFPINNVVIFLRKRIVNLVFPYISWIVLRLILLVACERETFKLITVFEEITCSGFWFLRILFYINVVMAIISIVYDSMMQRLYENRKTIVAVCLIMCGLIGLYFASRLPGCYNLWKHYCFFVLGLILHQIQEKYAMPKAIGFEMILLTIFIVSLGLMHCLKDTLVGELADIIAALSGSTGVFLLSKHIAMEKSVPFIESIGKRTLGIYAVHWILFVSVRIANFQEKLLFLNNSYAISVVLGILWIVFSYCITALLEKNCVLRRLFLGK